MDSTLRSVLRLLQGLGAERVIAGNTHHDLMVEIIRLLNEIISRS